MNKNCSERVEEEVIKFADDIEGVENHEICPFLSYQGVLVRCRKDCAWFRHTEGACAIHVISSRRR